MEVAGAEEEGNPKEVFYAMEVSAMVEAVFPKVVGDQMEVVLCGGARVAAVPMVWAAAGLVEVVVQKSRVASGKQQTAISVCLQITFFSRRQLVNASKKNTWQNWDGKFSV